MFVDYINIKCNDTVVTLAVTSSKTYFLIVFFSQNTHFTAATALKSKTVFFNLHWTGVCRM